MHGKVAKVLISICTCSINAKWEAQTFIDALYLHNPDTEFEICLVHDNRVQDGAWEVFDELKKKYSSFNLITSTFQDSYQYLHNIIQHYRTNNVLPPKFIDFLEQNLEQYENGTLYDPTRLFFWLPSGWLYNYAAQKATGDLLIFCPSDYLFLFSLNDLATHVHQRTHENIAYFKLNGLRRVISNSSQETVMEYLKQYRGQKEGPQCQGLRDFMRYPPRLNEMCIPDTFTSTVLPLTDPEFIKKGGQLAEQSSDLAVQVHGLHVLTRTAYDWIGGFSEEFYGRAWSDDKMSAMGLALCGLNRLSWELPHKFSFVWTPRSTFPKTPSTRELEEHDPWTRFYYPIDNKACYLDSNFRNCDLTKIIGSDIFNHQAGRLIPDRVFERMENVVRFQNHG